MNVEETIKHLGNHWELYKLANIKNVKEQEPMFARISDRILDMCRPIHMETVESKRVASGKHKHEILKEIFGKEEPSDGDD